MINLRYHVVSLTAVFLALGIGLAFGSTFLDKATVDTLNRQVRSLEGSLEDRDTKIGELEGHVQVSAAESDALDVQGSALLEGRAAGISVIVLTARGADESDVTDTLQALTAAGAQVHGTWWMTERFKLDDEGERSDLATVLGATTTDPAQLRRSAISGLARELEVHLHAEPPADPAGEPAGEAGEQPIGEEGGEPPAGESDDPAAEPAGPPVDEPVDDADAPNDDSSIDDTNIVAALFDNGFLDFQAVPGGGETPAVPDGVQLVIVGGSGEVADDLVLLPLINRLAANDPGTVIPAVVTSALDGDGEISSIVTVVRQDEDLREILSTVDSVEHFAGRAALVLTLADVAEARVGHYGLGEGSTQLLPPPSP